MAFTALFSFEGASEDLTEYRATKSTLYFYVLFLCWAKWYANIPRFKSWHFKAKIKKTTLPEVWNVFASDNKVPK